MLRAIDPARHDVPTFIRFDHSARLAFLEPRDEVSREEAVAQIRAVCAELTELHTRCPGRSYGVLLDTTTTTTVPTPNDLLRVLDEIGAHGELPATTRWAVFATKPVHYGMGRLFQAHAETRGVQVRVFATRESALVWLSGASSGRDVARDGEAEH